MPKMSHQDDTDADLFRQAMRGTRRLAGNNRVHVRPRPVRPEARFSRQDEQDVLDALLAHEIDTDSFATGDELEYRRAGLQDTVMRRLRRGYYSRQAELDLHGNTVEQAREALVHFLLECRRSNWRCVRIIHGKGLRSGPRGPVIKHKLAGWLRHREEVLAYTSAQANEGGSGAVYVLLRNQRK